MCVLDCTTDGSLEQFRRGSRQTFSPGTIRTVPAPVISSGALSPSRHVLHRPRIMFIYAHNGDTLSRLSIQDRDDRKCDIFRMLVMSQDPERATSGRLTLEEVP
jgi:hypothetical protein